jgi:hypothetical protein
MGILKAFGLDSFVEGVVNERGIHHPSNILTLAPSAHAEFDRLHICFDQVGVRFPFISGVAQAHLFNRRTYTTFGPRM